MSTTRLPTTTTSCIHLRPQINKKLNCYDNHHKKTSRPYFKFQTGSTTTFSGYTRINNLRDKNENYPQQQQASRYGVNREKSSATNNYIPPLMNHEAFRYPPQKSRRTIAHATQFQNRTSAIIDDTNDYYIHDKNIQNNIKSASTFNKFNGLVLSDSMCKHVRAEKLSSKQVHVKLSFESGCTCRRMVQFLEQQTNITDHDIFEANLIVYSLCTNDVGNIGATAAIRQCRELINLTRKLFPTLQAIGLIALSPRFKPSRLYKSEETGAHYHHFNQLMVELGQEMNFDIIHANLQPQHLHIDGLHPSISSGRNLIENALTNWFNKKITMLTNSTIIKEKPMHSTTTTTTTYANKSRPKPLLSVNKDKVTISSKINNNNQNNQNNHYNDQNKNYIPSNKDNYCNDKHIQFNSYTRNKTKIFNHHDNNDNNKYDQTSKEKSIHLPGKTLIPHYPHFLRHKGEFFRKIKIPEELENNKDDIFLLSNLHFQTEYFKTEAEKWKIYMTAAKKTDKTIQQIEPMDIIIEENDSLPIARPSPTGLAGPPAPLDFTDLAEMFDEWLPEPTPGQKRKIGHRRDDPPTPPSPRQPPPVVPRRTLPPRDPNQPLVGGSFHQPPNVENTHNQQRSFNAQLPIEKQNKSPIRIPSTMIISPIQSSTPEPLVKSPSVVPKNPIVPNNSFNFAIIPIECRYHFKKTKQSCTFETIKIHWEFLERKYKMLEDKREDILHTSFNRQTWTQVVNFVKSTIEKSLENKKNGDRKRFDNLLLD